MSELQLLNEKELASQTSNSKTTKTSTKTVKSSSRTVTTSTVSKSSTSSSSTSSTTKAEEVKESSIKSLTASETSGSSSSNGNASNSPNQLISVNQNPTQTAAQKKEVQTVVEEKIEVVKSEKVQRSQIAIGSDGVEEKTEEINEDQKVELATNRDEKKQEIVEKMMTDESGKGVCLAQMIKEEASQASQNTATQASAFTRSGPQGTESGHHEDAKEASTFRREIRVQANAAAYVEKVKNASELLKLTPSKNDCNDVSCIECSDQSDQATLNFDLSEFETESISIIIEDNKMTVHAVKKRKAGDEESKEEFSRVYDLPEDKIDQSHVSSSIFQDGVLSIELPYKSAILGL